MATARLSRLPMLSQIPTHLIAGPLGAGKTSLIRHLLAHKPVAERWAVLINEFGQIGLDQALLTTAADGISLAEVPGGCLCCVNGAPFQVGLARLLRQARPDRLLIEPSGLGHPAELLGQLAEAPWAGVLALQPLVLVLDAAALAAGQPLPASQQAALDLAGLVLLNKAENLDDVSRAQLQATLPALPLYWTTQGQLPLSVLPGIDARVQAAGGELPLAQGSGPLPALWSDPRQPICQVQEQAEGWSIGWRWHPSQQFELLRVQQWLGSLPWRRAKLVLQTNAGWLSANALDQEAPHWRASEWRKDSRLELIFSAAQDQQALNQGLAACLLAS
jgi:G3E family GTPase